MRRWPHLDGLRAAAAGLVLVSHVGFWTARTGDGFVGGLIARGDSGVAVFFALSAFLLAGPWWCRPTLAGPAQPVRSYAARRAARLLPAYFLVLLAVLVAAALGLGGGLHSAGRVVVHLFLLQGYTGDVYQAFSQTWSLTTEVTFYALLPLTAPLVARFGPRSPVRALAACVLVAVVGLLVQALFAPQGGSPNAAALATSVAGHAAWFAVGLAVLVLRTAPPPRRGSGAWSLLTESPATMLLVALTAYAVSATPLAGPRGLVSPSFGQALAKEALYAVIAGSLLLAATARSGPLAAALDTRAARSLGEMSYGIFLWHLLALQVVYALTGLRLFSGQFWLVLVAVVTLTVLASAASWHLVERPILTRVRARTRPASAAEPANASSQPR